MWMSEDRDRDYKPLNFDGKQTRPLPRRPKRATRAITSYAEKVVVITSDEEESDSNSTASTGDRRERLPSLDIERETSVTDSVSTPKSEAYWSPYTVKTKTDNLITGLADLQTHLRDTRMAREGETSLAEVLKMMMQMNASDKEERQKRDDEREQQQLAREEKRLKDLKDRENERRIEEERREERRELREQKFREETEEREAKLLLALKEAQPMVPQTVHISGTKLPKMTEGEDLTTFIELLEAVMEDNHIPRDQWKAKVHAALDTTTKLKVRDTITNPDATYAELKVALLGCGDLSFSHASETLMTGERGDILAVPIRQAIQRWQRVIERMTTEATTIKEACSYIAVAVAHYNTNLDLKTYLDMKGDFSKDLFCRNIDEWLATKQSGVKWAKRGDNSFMGNRQTTGRPSQQGRPRGDC